MDAFTRLSAFTLKNAPDRFVFHAVPVKEDAWAIGPMAAYFVPKAAPEAATVVPVLRAALDRMWHVLVRTAPEDPLRIVEARLGEPPEGEPFGCPDRPEMTPAFWARQEALKEAPIDRVRWVASPQPGCSSYLVRFYLSAAPWWIHPLHPRANEMLEVAQRSIDENLKVQPFHYSDVWYFLADLRPVSR